MLIYCYSSVSGSAVRLTTQGAVKVDGIFISRLVEGGLAESTGLLGINDEVIEVNGIDVGIVLFYCT